MSHSRQSSPDWLRSFQESIHSIWTLSSDSEAGHDHSPKREDHIDQWKVLSYKDLNSLVKNQNQGMELSLAMMESLRPKRLQKKSLSQKPIDVEGHTPVKGKEKKGSAKRGHVLVMWKLKRKKLLRSPFNQMFSVLESFEH